MLVYQGVAVVFCKDVNLARFAQGLKKDVTIRRRRQKTLGKFHLVELGRWKSSPDFLYLKWLPGVQSSEPSNMNQLTVSFS